MPVSAVDVVKMAVQRTIDQLFKPFRLGHWTRLAVTGLLAGELSSTGGCTYQIPFSGGGGGGGDKFMAQSAGIPEVLMLIVIPLLLIAGVALVIALIYVSSMMRFVLFDSVTSKECHIREYWNRRREPGFRYFLWQLVFAFAAMSGVIAIIGAAAVIVFGLGLQANPRAHLLPLILIGLIFLSVFFVFMVLVIGITVLTKDFVVPQMALENISAMEGWRRLWAMMKAEARGYAGYLGLKLLLAVGTAVVLGIAVLLVVLALFIPFGGVSVAAILGGRAIGLSWNALTLSVAIVAVCLVLAACIYAALLVTVPSIVFFPAYAYYFFASRYEPLNALMSPSGEVT